MKYLDVKQLELLSSALSLSSPSIRVTTRIEAYSCKSVARERKLFKHLDSELTSDLELSASVSPPEHHPSLFDSPFGRLDKKESRKTLWLLIATLNAAFPDHDFSRVKAEDFAKEESARSILVRLSDTLTHARSSNPEAVHRTFADSLGGESSPTVSTSPGAPSTTLLGVSGDDLSATDPILRQVLESVIDVSDCEVYRYTPDLDSDPYAVDVDDDDDDDTEDDDRQSIDSAGRVGHDDEMWTMDDVVNPLMETSLRTSRTIGNSTNAFIPGRQRTRTTFDGRLSIPGTPVAFASASPLGSNTPVFNKTISSFWTPSDVADMVDSNSSFEEDETSTGGLLWSAHHFLFNRKQKRILFVSVCGRKTSRDRPSMTRISQAEPLWRGVLLSPSLKRLRSGTTTPTFTTTKAVATVLSPSRAIMVQPLDRSSSTKPLRSTRQRHSGRSRVVHAHA